MKEIDVTPNERICNLMEEVLVKLSCLLSELNDDNDDTVDNVIMSKVETNIEDEREMMAKMELTDDTVLVENKEHMVVNSDDKEEIKLCGEQSFVSCSFTL